jgi:hypothetical protein
LPAAFAKRFSRHGEEHFGALQGTM